MVDLIFKDGESNDKFVPKEDVDKIIEKVPEGIEKSVLQYVAGNCTRRLSNGEYSAFLEELQEVAPEDAIIYLRHCSDWKDVDSIDYLFHGAILVLLAVSKMETGEYSSENSNYFLNAVCDRLTRINSREKGMSASNQVNQLNIDFSIYFKDSRILDYLIDCNYLVKCMLIADALLDNLADNSEE